MKLDHVMFADDVDQALAIARDLAALNSDWEERRRALRTPGPIE